MKTVIFRIVLLTLTVAAIAATPVIMQQIHYKNSPKVAQFGGIPTAGQSFPIAGQEEAEVSGGLVITAPDDCEVGELVRIDASQSDVDHLTWQIIPATTDFEVIEAGRRAFFSARKGAAGQSFLIIISAAKKLDDGTVVSYLQHHTIDVLGEAPEPGPETISTKVRRWVRDVKEYPKREDHALALAQVFRKLGTAEDITVDQILEATATANSAVLGEDLERWMPFLEPLGVELDEIELKTRDDYKDVWLKIADGIEKGI